MALTAEDWITKYAGLLGVNPPSEEELNALLALAGIAAHASERTAAPIACWLAAKASMPPSDAVEQAKQLADSTGNRSATETS
ncbi:MAG: DUF6457 domain-containing protein [Acidimicrobiales bacterium]